MFGKQVNFNTSGFFFIPRMTRSSGIFVTDEEEDIFSAFFKVLAHEQQHAPPKEILDRPDNAANMFIRNYNMVAVLSDKEGTVCYSVNYLNQMPEEFTDRIRQFLGLTSDSLIFWADDVFKEPEEGPAREIIFGERPVGPEKPDTRAKIRRRWAHPKGLNRAEMDYLSGKSKEPPPPSP